MYIKRENEYHKNVNVTFLMHVQMSHRLAGRQKKKKSRTSNPNFCISIAFKKKKTYVTANVTRHFTKRHVQETHIVTLQLAVVLDEALRGGEFIKTG